MQLNCDDNDFKALASNGCFQSEKSGKEFDQINTTGWTNRRNCFGGTISNPGHSDDRHFAYSPKVYFLIGTLEILEYS